MSETYEQRRDAKRAAVRRIAMTALNDLPSDSRLSTRDWLDPEGGVYVTQPVDPKLYGTDVLFAETSPWVEGGVILVMQDRGSGDYLKVMAFAPHDYNADRNYSDKGWGVLPREFFTSDVYAPREDTLRGNVKPAEVNVTGGGSRDPYRVVTAARVLHIAAKIAMRLNSAEGLS